MVSQLRVDSIKPKPFHLVDQIKALRAQDFIAGLRIESNNQLCDSWSIRGRRSRNVTRGTTMCLDKPFCDTNGQIGQLPR